MGLKSQFIVTYNSIPNLFFGSKFIDDVKLGLDFIDFVHLNDGCRNYDIDLNNAVHFE